jgi:hypothetical protein
MNCVLAEVVPVADTPHGPPANEIELDNAHLKIGDSPLRERPDLGRKTYKVLRYRSSQGCVSQEWQCRERRRIIHRDPPVCELPRLKAKDLLYLDTIWEGSPWIGGPAWEKDSTILRMLYYMAAYVAAHKSKATILPGRIYCQHTLSLADSAAGLRRSAGSVLRQMGPAARPPALPGFRRKWFGDSRLAGVLPSQASHYLNEGFSGTAAPSLRGSEAPKWTPPVTLITACPPPIPPEY